MHILTGMIELLPLALVVLYFAPFMVAAARDHDSFIAILLVNTAVGWTIIGWILVLSWALLSPPHRSTGMAHPSHLRTL